MLPQQLFNEIFYYNVISNSMYPLIKFGDRICVKLFPERVKIGDIVVFNFFGHLCVHRIVSKKLIEKEIGYVTKGDFSLNFDNNARVLCLKDIVGKVTQVENKDRGLHFDNKLWSFLGYFIAFFSNLQATLFWNAKKIKIVIFKESRSMLFILITKLYKRVFLLIPLVFSYLFRKQTM